MRWVGSKVTLTNLPMCGTWYVDQKLNDSWYEISPRDNPAIDLAMMSPTGKMWVQAKDMSRAPIQIEELF